MPEPNHNLGTNPFKANFGTIFIFAILVAFLNGCGSKSQPTANASLSAPVPASSQGSSVPPSSESASVSIIEPASGSTVVSPVAVQATVTDAKPIHVTQIYVDGTKITEALGAGIRTDISLIDGSHILTVQAIEESTGNTIKSSVNINVANPSGAGQEGIPPSGHVVLVIEENHTYAQVLAAMPWLVSMGNTYGHALNYHADEPGSLLDYLWLSSGSGEQTFGCSGGACSKAITDQNIFRVLDGAKLSWKVYAQSLPSTGYMGAQSGAYVKRHNPAPWYSNVINSATLQKKMVPFSDLATDIANGTLPNYSIIVPDLNNDAHDGTLGQADDFLSHQVAPVLDSSVFKKDGLMIVTFDECDGAIGACSELVYTAVIGPNVKRGSTSNTLYKHESTLRTILDALGLKTFPGASANVKPMADFF